MATYWTIDGDNNHYSTLADAKAQVLSNTPSDNHSWLRNCYGSFPVISKIEKGEISTTVEIRFDTITYKILGFGKPKKWL